MDDRSRAAAYDAEAAAPVLEQVRAEIDAHEAYIARLRRVELLAAELQEAIAAASAARPQLERNPSTAAEIPAAIDEPAAAAGSDSPPSPEAAEPEPVATELPPMPAPPESEERPLDVVLGEYVEDWLARQRGWNAIQGPGQPLCRGVKVQPPGKGRPCEHRAMDGSDWCWSHDPQRELERQAQTARMRAQVRRQPMLPAGPFVAWLEQLHTELGAWKRVGDAIGMHHSQAHQWSRGRTSAGRPLKQVSVRVVRRCAEHAGTTLEAIYGDVAAELAA